MRCLIKIILLFCSVTYCVSKHDDVESLKSVAVLFRHGERNIYLTYPNDPWKNASYWEGGLGQLRQKGKWHHYNLGKWFRERYNGFLSDTYSPDEIKVQSTDVDRTLMSVTSHLAGLFPPKGNQLWNQLINWQPIPIPNTPLGEDPVLGEVTTCPRYDQLFQQMEQSEEVQKQWNQTDVDYIIQHSGKQVKVFLDLLDFHDTLFVEIEDMNFTVPAWTDSLYPEPLNKYSAFAFSMQAYNQDLQRFKVGPLYHDIIGNFNSTVANNKTYKYKIYSSHDVNVANILQSFGAYEQIRPPYASAVIFELRQNPDTKKHFVNVLYKNSTDPSDDTLHEIKVKTCQFDCDFDEFRTLLKPITIEVPTFWEECKKKTSLLEEFVGERQQWIKP